VSFGRTTWENIVTACKKCNQKKGDRSVEQMGFKLFKKPKAPQWLPGVIGNVQTKAPPEVWGPYLVNVYEK
jgi:5-methylcytosine-specific restriction endonuclease McrA